VRRELRAKVEALLALEEGTIQKPRGGGITVCLLYPNTYHVGMSNLGVQGVYGFLNERDDVVCERAFLPGPEDVEEHVRTGEPLRSMESGTPVARFDIVAFSVSFENDYPGVLRMLELAGIPFGYAERGKRDPLVVFGGMPAMSNPEPLAPFFDVVFVGEAEELLPAFLEAYGSGLPRDDFLRRAARIPGIYVPRLYEELYGPDGTIRSRVANEGAPDCIQRRTVQDAAGLRMHHTVTTPETEFADMVLVEVQRGCPRRCRFCLVGHTIPYRAKGLDALMAEVESARARTGRVGLIGPSLSDYPHALEVLSVSGVDFSISSLRASPRSAALVDLMTGARSISIAPEVGTQRLRDAIGKRLGEEDILETSALILDSGVRRLRLYFMVGLPGETEDDALGIVELVGRIRARAPRGEITLTVSTFVPKPFTPFEREPMAPLKTVKARLQHLKKGLDAVRGVRVFHDVPKYAYLQGMLSLGDRRVARVLRAMLREPDWRRAAREAGVDPDFYTLRRKAADERLPWDFIRP
jgi:radical SAM superfamily enzyme YgiQ (UPF0313 family)